MGGSISKVEMLDCGVIRKRLAHDTPAFVGDLHPLRTQFFDVQVSGKSPKQNKNVFISNTVIRSTLEAFDVGISVESLRERLRVATAPVKRGQPLIAPNAIQKNPFSCFC